MKQLNISLRDCYGIGELDQTFDFDIHPGAGHDHLEHSQTNIVYARNGTMKTSFAKTLYDYSQDKTPIDGLHGRKPVIKLESDGVDFPHERVCVLRSNDEYFESDKMAMLLSNKKDQARYAEIMNDIEDATTALFDNVSKSMSVRGGAAKTLELFDSNYMGENYNRLALIVSMENEVRVAKIELLGMEYKLLDNKKVADFLDKPSTKSMLKDYVEIYEQLLKQSEYFQDGLFDYGNALKVQKSLDENNFMKKGVGNKVIVVTKSGEEKVFDSIDDLKAEYEKDKNKIFETLDKQLAYDKFDAEIGANPDLRSLQQWVRKHKDLVPHLQNYKHTKSLVWQAHFAENVPSYDNLLQTYRKYTKELDELIQRSKGYASEWKRVVEDFKESFRPKFDIQVRNEEDVVLKRVKPELIFIYHDDRGGAPKEVPVQFLNENVFSTGERRALYLLCMMFEVKIRILSGEETVLVLDDIADSFDYKNKYAIIEYLYDLSVDYSNNIHMIILTHNYDFFRSLRQRCQMTWRTSPKVFLARRDSGKITLQGAVHADEFGRLKDLSSTNIRAALSLVPMARNIIEYREGHSVGDYATLTDVMHNKIASSSISIDTTISLLTSNVRGLNLASHASTHPVQDKIITEADAALADGNDDMLEDKIILAMGIRLRAERHMKYIYSQDGKTLDDERGEQTGRWYGKFCTEYPNHPSIPVLKIVNIVTPETLHINSFMYEPIIDMSIEELQKLYDEVSVLVQ